MPSNRSSAASTRRSLDHPIIDADGHFVELSPIVDDHLAAHLEAQGGNELRDRYLKGRMTPFDTSTVLRGRGAGSRQDWRAMPSWWGWQTRNTLDRATSHLPKLLHERLDALGIDFTILYPSTTLAFVEMDNDLGGPVCRAVNTWLAEMFAPYADRMTVGALIPMSTPELAVAELRHAVTVLGFKAVVISGYVRRTLGPRPGGGGPRPYRLDHFGIDSDYDYDPVWAACVELGVAPISHSSHHYHRVSRSPSNYVFNHIGGLATSHESMAKSLFLDGVTRRFPTLSFGFLEGGVAWAVSLFAELVGHWEKRNARAIMDLDPDRLDVDALMDYMHRFGDDDVLGRLDRIRQHFSRPAARPAQLDDFVRAEITTVSDFIDLFASRFYFGCEADDPLVAWAFNERINPLGARLRPIFGSDISHWDVPDMTEPVPEAHDLIDRRIISAEEFREFTFLNPLRLHAGMNPRFFEGTICETAVAEALADESA